MGCRRLTAGSPDGVDIEKGLTICRIYAVEKKIANVANKRILLIFIRAICQFAYSRQSFLGWFRNCVITICISINGNIIAIAQQNSNQLQKKKAAKMTAF